MLYDRFILDDCLKILEIPIDDFNNYSVEDLKRHYRKLVRKYHPDLSNIYSFKMSKINDAMDKIDKMIKNGIIKLKDNNNFAKLNNQRDTKSQENRTTKETNQIRNLYNRLDKLSSKVYSRKKLLVDKNQVMIIDESLEYYDEILEKIKIVSSTNSIYDYGIILNYVELFEYFYVNTLHVDTKYIFDFNHSNHIKNSNDKIEVLKDKVCLIHKQLLCNELKKIIKCFNQLKACDKEIIKTIENIDKEIINLKWYMCLNTFDFNYFDKKVKELIKK